MDLRGIYFPIDWLRWTLFILQGLMFCTAKWVTPNWSDGYDLMAPQNFLKKGLALSKITESVVYPNGFPFSVAVMQFTCVSPANFSQGPTVMNFEVWKLMKDAKGWEPPMHAKSALSEKKPRWTKRQTVRHCLTISTRGMAFQNPFQVGRLNWWKPARASMFVYNY